MIGFVLIDSYMQLIDEEEESNSNSRMPTQASAKRRLIFFLNFSLIMNFIGTKANHTKCKLSGQCACVRAFVRTLFFIGIALLHLLNVISRNLTMHERSVHYAYTSSVHISSSLFAYYPAFILFVDKSVLFSLMCNLWSQSHTVCPLLCDSEKKQQKIEMLRLLRIFLSIFKWVHY